MEFFTEKELVTQTGHPVAEWPLVIVKELVDNALDACDQANIAPRIEVTAVACGISVKDNGPGLPDEVDPGQPDYGSGALSTELTGSGDLTSLSLDPMSGTHGTNR